MKDLSELDEQARQILTRNDLGTYSVPTHGLYPYQWNWDSAFAAIGYAQFDINRAWVELETLLSGQWSNGMVPHILFHTSDPRYFPGPEVWRGVGPIPSSGISQPPVLATLARLLLGMDFEAGEARLKALYPKILDWHRWFMTWRLDQRAVCITHPWEAGRDNAPDWDGAMARITPGEIAPYERRDTTHVDSSMRPTKAEYDRYLWLVKQGADCGWDQEVLLENSMFRVADPTMTFILLRACRDLQAIGGILGEDTSEISDWIATLEEGAKTLWNPKIECYDSRDALTGEWAQSISNASVLCWYAGLPNDRMLAHYGRIMDQVPYGFPSHDPESPRFDAKRYWRGPTWAMQNMMISIGLDEAGLAQGEALRETTAALIRDHGFAEYFDPTDGSPAGGDSFTWTAAVWLGWASPNAGKLSWAR